ncbi:membrane protein insertase YidC [Acrasis kona]|uniref:Membrane protein insertase YidC n=1 Tax=Acrasis kona TaxID=1008807 RepID=A0AAW2ZJA8_9EUKA
MDEWDAQYDNLCTNLLRRSIQHNLHIYKLAHPRQSSAQLFSMDDVIDAQQRREDEAKLADIKRTRKRARSFLIRLEDAATKDKIKNKITVQQFEKRCELLNGIRDKLNDVDLELKEWTSPSKAGHSPRWSDPGSEYSLSDDDYSEDEDSTTSTASIKLNNSPIVNTTVESLGNQIVEAPQIVESKNNQKETKKSLRELLLTFLYRKSKKNYNN